MKDNRFFLFVDLITYLVESDHKSGCY